MSLLLSQLGAGGVGATITLTAATVSLLGAPAPALSAGVNLTPGPAAQIQAAARPVLSAGATLAPSAGSHLQMAAPPSAGAAAILFPTPAAILVGGLPPAISAGALLQPAPAAFLLGASPARPSAGASLAPGPAAMLVGGSQRLEQDEEEVDTDLQDGPWFPTDWRRGHPEAAGKRRRMDEDDFILLGKK